MIENKNIVINQPCYTKERELTNKAIAQLLGIADADEVIVTADQNVIRVDGQKKHVPHWVRWCLVEIVETGRMKSFDPDAVYEDLDEVLAMLEKADEYWIDADSGELFCDGKALNIFIF